MGGPVTAHWKRLILVLLMGLAAGCASSGDVGEKGQELLTGKVDHVEVAPDWQKKLPVKVAILPFENQTEKPEAAEIVRRAFYNHFSSRRFQDVELHRVDAVLTEKGLNVGGGFLKQPPEELGRLLDAEGLVYGKITGFDRLYLGAYSQVSIELEARLVKAASGEELWKARHRETHHEGGISLDPLGLIPTVIRTALNIRDIEFLRTADDLSRTMLATIPEPAIGKVTKPPRITLVVHDRGGKWLKTGHTIQVAMLGDPGMVATFDIGEVKKGLPLSEEKQGVYTGSYKVMPGDTINQGMVVGHLMDERGNRADWVDPLSVVNVDTTPPEKPVALSSLGRDQAVYLKWADTTDKDVLEYRIYRSTSPRDGYVEAAKTQRCNLHDKGLKNGVPYYYKISAVDGAGNESPVTEPVRGIPVKPGPTPVRGTISVDTIWFEGSSPYVLKEKTEVLKGATLTVEPGCIIQSQGPGIVVRGRLLAQGREDNLIQMIGPAGKEGPGWEGVTFDNTNDAESRVAFCKIKQARTAITMISSSPAVLNSTLTGNWTGIAIKEFSKPKVTGNTILGNSEAGLFCERSEPEIAGNTISENAGGGIICQNAMPVIKHNNLLANGTVDLKAVQSSPTILAAPANWWGSTDADKIAQRIQGPVSYASVLDGPHPGGRPLDAPRVKRAEPTESSPPVKTETPPAAPTGKEDIAAQARQYFLQGMGFYQERKIPEALKVMQKAVQMDPTNAGYRYNLGLAFSEVGDTAKAVEEWKKVMELDPQNQNAKMLLELYAR